MASIHDYAVQTTIRVSSADEAAIRALFERSAQAWNRGDGNAFAAICTEDADYIDVTGTRTKGTAAIAESHQRMFDTFMKGSILEGQLIDMRYLAPDVILAHGTGAVRLQGQEVAPADRQSIATYVLVKRDGQWLLTAFQNNRIMPNPVPDRTSQDG
jgi:uncharacterized protein (TIGR02246 family)